MCDTDPTKRLLPSSYIEEINNISWMIDEVFVFDKKIAIGQPSAAFWGYAPVSPRSITGTFVGEVPHFLQKWPVENSGQCGFSGNFAG